MWQELIKFKLKTKSVSRPLYHLISTLFACLCAKAKNTGEIVTATDSLKIRLSQS